MINFKGALFYYLSDLTYATMFGIQSFVPKMFPLVAREYHDGIYPVSCYYLATVGLRASRDGDSAGLGRLQLLELISTK